MRALSGMSFGALCLYAAILIYALAGSPTPDNPGFIEAAIGVFLMLAAGMGAFRRLRTFDAGESFFFRSLHILFIAGLILPTLVGALRGNDVMLIARDLLAFLFICLPLFTAHFFEGEGRARRILVWLCAGTGIVFAVRTLMPAFNIWIPQGELLYLSNSPLVLFAALFMIALAWPALTHPSQSGLFRLSAALAALAALGVIVAAMLLDVQRATVMAIAITLALLWLDTLIRTPKRAVIPVLLLLILGAACYPWLSEAGHAIARKTADVGLNMRAQELEAVLAALSANPSALLLGTGWGGTVASPAVAGLEVNYTHSLLSTMFLKGGIVLLGLSLAVCAGAVYQIFLIFQGDRGRGLALFWPFIIPVFLYASHKSLDFGLLLLLIGVWSKRRR